MLCLDIPGQDRITIEHVVLDFNGTIAIDGELIAGVARKLEELHSLVAIHIITADTNETARSQLEPVPCTLKIIGRQRQDEAKLAYARNLGLSRVLAIGNGSNDSLLLKEAALGICVIQGEGAAFKSMQAADIVCGDINAALEMLLRPHRITATLRT
jgi:soluble P-type ATPase